MVVSSEGCSPIFACQLLSVAFTDLLGRKAISLRGVLNVRSVCLCLVSEV